MTNCWPSGLIDNNARQGRAPADREIINSSSRPGIKSAAMEGLTKRVVLGWLCGSPERFCCSECNCNGDTWLIMTIGFGGSFPQPNHLHF